EDVLSFGELVALRGLLAPDGALVARAEELLLDAAAALGVNHVEADPLGRLGGRVELHRNGDEAEGDGTGCKGTGHLTTPISFSTALRVGQFNMSVAAAASAAGARSGRRYTPMSRYQLIYAVTRRIP